MAIPFLNNIDLTNNQLLNAKLQVTGTQPQSAPGQIYFDSGFGLALYHDNNNWIRIRDTTLTPGAFVSAADVSSGGTLDFTVDLSATGTPDVTKYLRGDNTWSLISDIAGTTYDLDSIQVGSDVAITLIGSNATLDTVTLVAGTNITLTDDGSANITIDAANPDQTVTLTGDVTGTGTTSIATTISAGAVDFAMLNSTDVITAVEGIENNDNDVTIPTSAAVKAYADSLIVGGLIYQGGYDANLNSPDLTTSPNSILKGWTYTVTADGAFFGEQLRVGDVLIAEVDDPSALADWTTVQNNIDLATDLVVGLGNVVPGSSSTITAPYSSGTATLDVVDSTPTQKGAVIVGAGTGISVAYSNGTATVTNTQTNSDNTFSGTIGNGSATSIRLEDSGAVAPNINHGLGTDSTSFMIQLVNVSSGETVYADVTRGAGGQVTIDFAVAPATNDIRVLIQKIG